MSEHLALLELILLDTHFYPQQPFRVNSSLLFRVPVSGPFSTYAELFQLGTIKISAR